MRGMLIVCVLSASCAVGEPAGDSKAGAGLGSDVESADGAPEVGILMLTMLDDDASVRAAVSAGAGGYVLKGDPQDRIVRVDRKSVV